MITVKVKVDWRERHKVLKLEFPCALSNVEGKVELPYGHDAIPVNGTEFPGQRWVAITGENDKEKYSVVVLNDSKYGFSVDENRLAM